MILELNKWLKDYCAANNLVYLDYFTPMVDDKGLLKRDLAEDGLHPNAPDSQSWPQWREQRLPKPAGEAKPHNFKSRLPPSSAYYNES